MLAHAISNTHATAPSNSSSAGRIVSDDGILQAFHRQFGVAIGVGIGPREPRADGCEFCPRLLGGDAGFQPTDDAQNVVAAIRAGCNRGVRRLRARQPERQPQLRARDRKREGRGHHPDNEGRHTVEGQLATDGGRVGAESALPQTVPDHRDSPRARYVVVGEERAAGDGADTGHVEDRGRARRRQYFFGIASRSRDGDIRSPVRGKCHRRLCLFPQIEVVGRRHQLALSRLGVALRHVEQLRRVRIIEWPQQHAVHETEDRAVGAHAEAKDCEYYEGEQRLFRVTTNGDANVLPEGAHSPVSSNGCARGSLGNGREAAGLPRRTRASCPAVGIRRSLLLVSEDKDGERIRDHRRRGPRGRRRAAVPAAGRIPRQSRRSDSSSNRESASCRRPWSAPSGRPRSSSDSFP